MISFFSPKFYKTGNGLCGLILLLFLLMILAISLLDNLFALYRADDAAKVNNENDLTQVTPR